MLEDILIKNGFNKKEAQIYLCVLQCGEIPISRLVSKTGIKRSTIYLNMENLEQQKVLSLNKKRGIQYVSAIKAEILIEKFQKKATQEIQDLKTKLEETEKYLPEFKNLEYTSPIKPRIKFFDGKEGIKQILREFSKSKEQGMGFTDYELMPPELLNFIQKEIIPERRKNRNKARFITTNNSTNLEVQKTDNKNYSNHKVLTFKEKNNPIELLLFENSKVAFVSFKREEMFGLIIESEAIYKTLKNIFDLNWHAI